MAHYHIIPLYLLYWYQEVDDFLDDSHLVRSHWRIHQSSINAYQGMRISLHLHFAGTIRMHALMIEELSLHKEIDAFEELRHLRMINHRHIKQSIIRHGIWCLPIARCITDTHGHHPALNHIRIDMDVHLVIQTLENHQDEREDE